MDERDPGEERKPRPTLWQFVSLFLLVGTVAIGGGRSIIAVMERELVGRRSWLSREEFADAYAMAHVIPGVYSANFGVILGFRFFGGLGAALAVVALVLPSFFMVLLLAKGYTLFHQAKAVEGAFEAVAPAVVGMFVAILVTMGKALLRTPFEAAIALAAAGSFLWLRLHPALLILGAGLAGYLATRIQRRR